MKYFLVVVYALMFSSAFGQDWPQDSTTWLYRLTTMGKIDMLKIEVTGDTVIQDHRCKILESSVLTWLTSPPNQDKVEKVFAGEKATNEKLYLRSSNDSIFYFDSDWKFLYSFDPNVGDQWIVTGQDSLRCYDSSSHTEVIYNATDTFSVLSVDDFKVDGFALTNISISSGRHWSIGNNDIIKHIGPRGSFLPSLNCTEGYPDQIYKRNHYVLTEDITCFSSPRTGIIAWDEELCTEAKLVTSIPELSSNLGSQLNSIFPTIADSYINISNFDNLTKMIFISADGSIAKEVIPVSHEVSIEDLLPGIYFVKFVSKKGQLLSSERMIKL